MRVFLTTLLVGSILGASADAAALANARQMGSTQIELSVNKASYAIGETVHIMLSLTNQGSEAVSFQFPTGQMYDLVLERADQRIWRWSDGRVFTQAFTTLLLRPGESKVFNEQWNQRDGRDRPAPPGDYEIVAVFPAQGLRVPSPTEGPRVRFRIGGETQVYKPDVSSNSVSIAGTDVGQVLLDGRTVLRIRVAAGGLTASERAGIVADRLRQMLNAGLLPAELRVARVGTEAVILWRSQLVVTADASHARLNKTTAHALASQWRQSMVHALAIRQ